MNPRTGLDSMAKRVISDPPGIEALFSVQRVAWTLFYFSVAKEGKK
jgi:hypothetical protein